MRETMTERTPFHASAGLPAEALRIAFESKFDDQWPEWMDVAWHEALAEVAAAPEAGLPTEALRAAIEKALPLIEPMEREEWGREGRRRWGDVDDAWTLLVKALAAAPEAGLPACTDPDHPMCGAIEPAPKVGLPDGLDVDRLADGLPSLTDHDLALLRAAIVKEGQRRYARLRATEASPIPPPLPGRSCRHGIVHDQCPYCDSPGADKEEATRRAIQRDSEASDR